MLCIIPEETVECCGQYLQYIFILRKQQWHWALPDLITTEGVINHPEL